MAEPPAPGVTGPDELAAAKPQKQARKAELEELELPAWVRKLESIPQVDPVVLLGFAPVALYLLCDRFWTLQAAIAAATIAAVLVFTIQRRLRPKVRVVFLISLLSLVVMIAFGIAGWIWEDGNLFWTADPVDDFLTAAIFLGSALFGRPIVGPFVRELFPDLADRLPGEHRVWRTITIVWGVKMLATGVLRFWLLEEIDAGTYVWIRTLIAWPVNLALFLWTLDRIRRTMRELALARGRAQAAAAHSTDSAERGEVVGEVELRKG